MNNKASANMRGKPRPAIEIAGYLKRSPPARTVQITHPNQVPGGGLCCNVARDFNRWADSS
jgi:hypothetical protein